MAKYGEQFKLSLVQQYLSGAGGYKFIAKQHEVPHEVLRHWVLAYRTHGLDGLKKKFSHYSAEFKLSVLRHMWDNALALGQTAALFNIRNPGSLIIWEREYRRAGLDGLETRSRGKPKLMSVSPPKPESKPDDEKSREDLQAELDYLRMENAYLKKLQALVQTRQQQASPKKRK